MDKEEYIDYNAEINVADKVENEGDDDMTAIAPSRNYATIIRREKKDAFLQKMKESIPTKEFWEDCKRASESFDDEEIKRMRELFKNAGTK